MRWKKVLGIIFVAGIIIVLTGVGVISLYDYNRLKPRIAEAVEKYTGRKLYLDGDIRLDFGLLPRLTVTSVRFQNAPWGARPDLADIKQLSLQVDLLPLIRGMLSVKQLSLLEADILIELNTSGESNLSFDLPEAPGKETPQPDEESQSINILRSFAVMEVYLEKVKLRIKDHYTGETATLDVKKFTLKAPRYGGPTDITAEAVLNGRSFDISGGSGAISDIFKENQPWPFNITVNGLGVGITVSGTSHEPPSTKSANIKCSVSCADLSSLQDITGWPLPRAPFSFSGHIVYRGTPKIEVTGLQLKLADNTVTGNVSVESRQGLPLITAKLKSDQLDLRPFVKDYKFEYTKEPLPPKSPRRKKVFPDKPFRIDFISDFETSVDAEIKQLILPGFAAEDFNVRAALKCDRLNMKLMTSKIGGGRLTFNLDLVPQEQQIDISTFVGAENIDLAQMFEIMKIKNSMEGVLDLTARLKSQGNSVAALMAGLDGDFIIKLGNGRMPLAYLNRFGSIVGANLLKLLNPFDVPVDNTRINCLVADFNINQGMAKSDIIVIDDPRKTLIGHAEINLKTEALFAWIETKPKEGIGFKSTGKVSISLKELTKPFLLAGTLANPRVELHTKKTVKTVGKALLGPAGIAWLVLSGTSGKDDPCANALKIVGDGPYVMDTDKKKKGR